MEIHELQEMTTPQEGFWLPIDTGEATYKIDYSKVKNQEIQNNLTTTEPGCTLDAVQGHVLNESIGNIKDSIANTESGDTSANAYDKGDVFFYDETLMKAKRSIAAGENLTEGTNMTASTVAEAISGMVSENNVVFGRVSFSSVSANSVSSISVNFGKTLKAAPYAVASIADDSYAYSYGGVTVGIGSVTQTGMRIYVYNNTSAAKAVAVNYLALTF